MNNFQIMGDYYNKTQIIIAMVCVLNLIVIAAIYDILLFFGIEPIVCWWTQIYLAVIIPGTFCFCYYRNTKSFFFGIRKPKYTMSVIMVTSCLHVGWCYVFVAILGWGPVGLSIAYNITQATNYLWSLYLLRTLEEIKPAFFPISRKTFHGLWEYIVEMAPTVLLKVSDMQNLSINILIGSSISSLNASANVILQNLYLMNNIFS